MTENQSFFSDEDWELLLPGKSITLGSKRIFIRPFGLEDFFHIIKQIVALRDIFRQSGVDHTNFDKKIPETANVLLSEVPWMLSTATGIPEADLKRLPFSRIVEIVDVMLDVNIESQEGLEKNLRSLVGKIAKLREPTPVKEPVPTKGRKR